MTNPRTLTVRSELTVEAKGVTTRLYGNGSLLRWELVDPVAVLADRPGVDRTTLARIADALRDRGLTLSIEHAGKPLVELGATSSRLGSLLFRSSAVKLRAPFRLARIAVATR